ncbi:trimethylguanosine synthase, partial [Quercus suber]
MKKKRTRNKKNISVKAHKKRKRIIRDREKAAQNVSPVVEKYWFQRCVAATAKPNPVVIDCFAGVGGNAIQFARTCCSVVAIDIDPKKLEFAINNAKIYGVQHCIDFIVGDFFQLAPSLKGDIVFLAPPRGGPSYKSIENFTLDFLKPRDGLYICLPADLQVPMCSFTIFQFAQTITPNIIMFLPRNVDLQQVEELSWLSSPPLEVEFAQAITPNIIMFLPRNVDLQQVEELSWLSSPPLEVE